MTEQEGCTGGGIKTPVLKRFKSKCYMAF